MYSRPHPLRKNSEKGQASESSLLQREHFKNTNGTIEETLPGNFGSTLNGTATILDKINGKPRPPPLPPKSRIGKWRVFGLRAASSLIWGEWGFAVPFYFVQDCSLDHKIGKPGFGFLGLQIGRILDSPYQKQGFGFKERNATVETCMHLHNKCMGL